MNKTQDCHFGEVCHYKAICLTRELCLPKHSLLKCRAWPLLTRTSEISRHFFMVVVFFKGSMPQRRLAEPNDITMLVTSSKKGLARIYLRSSTHSPLFQARAERPKPSTSADKSLADIWIDFTASSFLCRWDVGSRLATSEVYTPYHTCIRA